MLLKSEFRLLLRVLGLQDFGASSTENSSLAWVKVGFWGAYRTPKPLNP